MIAVVFLVIACGLILAFLIQRWAHDPVLPPGRGHRAAHLDPAPAKTLEEAGRRQLELERASRPHWDEGDLHGARGDD